MSTVLRTVKGVWSTHSSVDLGVTVLVGGAMAVAAWRGVDVDVLGRITAQNASGIYIDVAQVVGLVNGFSLAALAFWNGADGGRLRRLRRQVGPAVTSSWLGAIMGSLAVAGLLVVVGILAAAQTALWLRWLVPPGLVFVVLAGLRLGWLFAQIVRLADLDVDDPTHSRGSYAPRVRRPEKPADDPPPAGNEPSPISTLRRTENT